MGVAVSITAASVGCVACPHPIRRCNQNRDLTGSIQGGSGKLVRPYQVEHNLLNFQLNRNSVQLHGHLRCVMRSET